MVKKKVKLKKKIKRPKIAKKRKYKITKKISMEEIYRMLNKVQISRKDIKFSVEEEEAATVQNVINDLELPHQRQNLKTKVVFIVKPGKEIEEDEEIEFDMDYFDDEILEDGQLF